LPFEELEFFPEISSHEQKARLQRRPRLDGNHKIKDARLKKAGGRYKFNVKGAHPAQAGWPLQSQNRGLSAFFRKL
jgi:hypothetical protein